MIQERYMEARAVRLALLTALLVAALGTGAASAVSWQTEVVDAAAYGGQSDMALDGAGNAHFSYYSSTNGCLMHASNGAGGWRTEVVDPVYCGWTSIALDAAGNPCISYTDLLNYDLKYAAYDGARWHTETVDAGGDVGYYTSLAIAGEEFPRISYYDWTNGDLKYAARDSHGWYIETVDAAGYVGRYTSLALDRFAAPRISYYDSTNRDLKFASSTGEGWICETTDSDGDVGTWTSLAVDAWDRPRISYCDATNGDLKYAARPDGGAWQVGAVDSAGNVGYYTCVVLDADTPRISYYDATNGDLKHAWLDGPGWQNETVDAGEGAGRYTSIAMGGAGDPRIGYVGSGGLKYARAVPPAPAIEVAVEVSGDFGNTWQGADVAPGPYLERLPMVPQFRYTITNTGDVPLLNCAIAGVASFGPLNPGMSRTEQQTYRWVAGQQVVEATATGTCNGKIVTDTDRAYYFGAVPAVAIEVLANGDEADAPPGPSVAIGSPVAWTYIVNNTGNVPLGNVTVTDNTGVAVTAPAAALAPGASMNATANGTAVAGPHANNGTVTGTPLGGLRDVSASDPSHYYGIVPRIANFTWTPAAPWAGQAIRFTDTSTDTPEWWEWSFGDGERSIERNPVHTFAAPGNYTVWLTAYYPGSEIGRDAVRNVTVSAPPIGGDTAFYLVSTTPAGAAVFVRDIDDDLHLAGNTSAGPLNVTVHLTGTPVSAIVANLSGYADAVFSIASYPSAGETVVVNLTLEPAVRPVPPATLAPTDTDGDGRYDDVNGNGREDFADVVLYFNMIGWIAVNEPLAVFDYNANGRCDFADVVWLFNHL